MRAVPAGGEGGGGTPGQDEGGRGAPPCWRPAGTTPADPDSHRGHRAVERPREAEEPSHAAAVRREPLLIVTHSRYREWNHREVHRNAYRTFAQSIPQPTGLSRDSAQDPTPIGSGRSDTYARRERVVGRVSSIVEGTERGERHRPAGRSRDRVAAHTGRHQARGRGAASRETVVRRRPVREGVSRREAGGVPRNHARRTVRRGTAGRGSVSGPHPVDATARPPPRAPPGDPPPSGGERPLRELGRGDVRARLR